MNTIYLITNEVYAGWDYHGRDYYNDEVDESIGYFTDESEAHEFVRVSNLKVHREKWDNKEAERKATYDRQSKEYKDWQRARKALEDAGLHPKQYQKGFAPHNPGEFKPGTYEPPKNNPMSPYAVLEIQPATKE